MYVILIVWYKVVFMIGEFLNWLLIELVVWFSIFWSLIFWLGFFLGVVCVKRLLWMKLLIVIVICFFCLVFFCFVIIFVFLVLRLRFFFLSCLVNFEVFENVFCSFWFFLLSKIVKLIVEIRLIRIEVVIVEIIFGCLWIYCWMWILIGLMIVVIGLFVNYFFKFCVNLFVVEYWFCMFNDIVFR